MKRAAYIALPLCLAFLSLPAAAAETAQPPFFPSLINTVAGGPISGDEFSAPDICAGCHEDLHAQWQGSMHAQAVVDPIFLALWKLGSKETKGGVDRLCLGCHTAIGVVSNGFTLDPASGEIKATDIARQGVQCDFCHTVKEHTILKTPTLDPNNASLLIEPGEVKRGPYKDADSPGHETAFSELHTRAEFCGSCHNVFHPVTHYPIERTYEEWKESVYARAGIQCQDCHMMPVEKAREVARTMKPQKNPGKASSMGPDRDQLYTHEFVGANFTVPTLLGKKQIAEIAIKRLQSAAELSLEVPPAATPGTVASVKVKVVNVGAGHNLPTSLTEVREMWLDLSVKDASGQEIYRSGALQQDGDLDPDAKVFMSHGVDASGHHTVKPWELSHFEWVTTIPPKGYAREAYRFMVPENAAGPLSVTAVLRYRSYPQAVANLLLGKDAPVLPVADMATAAGSLALK